MAERPGPNSAPKLYSNRKYFLAPRTARDVTRSDTHLVAGFVVGLVFTLFRVALSDLVPPFGGGPFSAEYSLLVTAILPLVVVPGAAVGAGYLLEQRNPGGSLGLPTVAFGVAALVGLLAGMWLASVVFPNSASVSTDLRSLAFLGGSLVPYAVHAAVAALAGALVADRNA